MQKNKKIFNHLGAYIEDQLLNEIGVSIHHAEKCMHLSQGSLKAIIQKKCNLSGKVAIRLEKVFNFDSKALLMRQDDLVLAAEKNSSDVFSLKPFDPTTVRIEKGKHPRAIHA